MKTSTPFLVTDVDNVYTAIRDICEHKEWAYPSEVAELTGLSLEEVKEACEELHHAGKLWRTGAPFQGPFESYVYSPNG